MSRKENGNEGPSEPTEEEEASLAELLAHPLTQQLVSEAVFEGTGVELFAGEETEHPRLPRLFLAESVGVTIVAYCPEALGPRVDRVWIPAEQIPLLKQAIEAHERHAEAGAPFRPRRGRTGGQA